MSVRESMPQVARTSMGTHAAVAWEWRRVTKIGAPAVKRSPHAQAVDRGQAPPSRPCLDYRSAASRTAVNLDRRRRAESAIDELRAAGVPVVAVETVAGAPYAHEFAFPPPPAGCALLLGNERRGAGVGPGRLFPEVSPEPSLQALPQVGGPSPDAAPDSQRLAGRWAEITRDDPGLGTASRQSCSRAATRLCGCRAEAPRARSTGNLAPISSHLGRSRAD